MSGHDQAIEQFNPAIWIPRVSATQSRMAGLFSPQLAFAENTAKSEVSDRIFHVGDETHEGTHVAGGNICIETT